jgi:hypothetical protein
LLEKVYFYRTLDGIAGGIHFFDLIDLQEYGTASQSKTVLTYGALIVFMAFTMKMKVT